MVTPLYLKIQRGSGTVQAQLVQLLTEGTASPNPRWLIRYVGNSKDDEVYEHSFLGKVGVNNDDTATTPSVEQNTVDDVSPVISDQQHVNEVAMENPRASKKKKNEQTNDADLVVNSDSSFGLKGAAKANKASSISSRSSNKNTTLSTTTRDVRSRRRGQPLPDKEFYDEKHDESARSDDRLSLSAGDINALSNQQQQRKRKLTGAAKMSVETKRERESKTAKSSSHTSSFAPTTKHNNTQKEEEECVKIKFLTGTLFLYRGKRRRAEFIRRV